MAAHGPSPGDVVRIRGARWGITHVTPYEDATVVEALGCDRENYGERAHFLLPFEPFDRLPLSRLPLVVPPRRWRRAARSAVAAASPAYLALDSAVTADFDLLPFQLEPAMAVTRGLGARVLIADEVGLGKTVQASLVVAEVLRRRPSEARAIVVCPAGLREQWQGELRERFHLESKVLDSASIAASATAAHASNPWAADRVVITSIDYVKRPEILRALEALVWDVAVFDEAHALSGRSDRRAAAGALADRARAVVMLTATPHSGDDEAFARLTSTGALDGEFPLLTFRRTRDDVGLALPRRTRWLRVRPSTAEARMHELLRNYARLVWNEKAIAGGGRLAMAVLTRRACSSAASLARSVERRLALLGDAEPASDQMGLPLPPPDEDDEPTAPLAWPGLADRAAERALLERLLILARDATRHESKVRTLTKLLRRVRQPVIVFTEYRDTLVHLQASLAPLAPALLHGGMSPRERRHVVAQFTNGTAALLLATDAASEGLNLHRRCRLVVNLELPWTPLRLEQRIGRVERIGQHRRVHAVHLVAAGTGEETTVATLWRRMACAGRVLSALRRLDADDTAIMQSIVEGQRKPLDEAAEMVHVPPDLLTPDLRDAAVAEARRLVRWRRLATRAPGVVARPCVSMVRRRSGPARCCWAFRTVYVDAAHRRIWETLGGMEGRAVRLPHRSSADVRRWFSTTWDALSIVLAHVESRERSALEADLRPVLDLAVRRERAIAVTLGGRRARMAATVIQPGLFDRRAEKAAAAQAAVVDEALARCEARLNELRDARSLSVERRDLVFAVVLA